jgi:hypothetical protein
VFRVGFNMLKEFSDEMWADRTVLEQEWRVSGGNPHPVLSSIKSEWVSLEENEENWWLEDVWEM